MDALDSMFEDMTHRVGLRSSALSSYSDVRAPGHFDGMSVGTSRVVETQTRIVNGRRIVRTTETVRNPDGSSNSTTRESVEDLNEDLPRLRGLK